MNNKQNRNEKCNCGSGKKYKHCCYSKDQVTTALNSLGVNKLYGFGAFYKDNEIDGFSCYLHDEPAEVYINAIHKCTQQQMNDIKNASPNIVKDIIRKAFNQLHELIPMWNELVYGTTERGEMGVMKTGIKLDNQEIQQLTFCICQDIHFLTEMKAIPNDEYNGMTYSYFKQ